MVKQMREVMIESGRPEPHKIMGQLRKWAAAAALPALEMGAPILEGAVSLVVLLLLGTVVAAAQPEPAAPATATSHTAAEGH